MDPKEALADWNRQTSSQIRGVLATLNDQDNVPPTLAAYDTYIGITFNNTNPALQALLKQARNDP